MLPSNADSARPQVDIAVRWAATKWRLAACSAKVDAMRTYISAPSCSTVSGCPLADVTPSTFDAAATWMLFETWRAIFVDSSLHNALKQQARCAASRGADPAMVGPIIQHVANH